MGGAGRVAPVPLPMRPLTGYLWTARPTCCDSNGDRGSQVAATQLHPPTRSPSGPLSPRPLPLLLTLPSSYARHSPPPTISAGTLSVLPPGVLSLEPRRASQSPALLAWGCEAPTLVGLH